MKYQRVFPQNGGFTTKKSRSGSEVFDDRHVVPYNPYILIAWDGHANIEYVVSSGTPDYAIRYVLKGSSKSFLGIMKQGPHNNPYIKCNGNVVDVDEAKLSLNINC